MEEKLSLDTIRYYDPVLRTNLSATETAEGVLGDSMPDIERILDASASAYLRSKTLSDGRITVEGALQATVLYVGQGEPRIQKWELTAPLLLTGEAPELRETDALTVWLCVESAEAEAVTPRTLSLRAEVGAAVAVYRPETLDISTLGADAPGFQTLREEREISYIASVGEKSFAVSEELSLPAGRPPLSRLLAYHLQTMTDETKQVAGKMILQGSVRVHLLYLTAEEDTPLQETFSVPFSQIMDAPGDSAATAAVTLCPTACYLEPLPGVNGSRSLSLELQLTAQTLCRVERRVEYIADAYCLRCPCSMERETVSVNGAERVALAGDTLRQTVEIPETAGEVLFAYAEAGIPILGEGKAHVSVTAHMLYRSERGDLSSAVKRLRSELSADVGVDSAVDPGVPLCGEAHVTSAGDSLEVRVPLELRLAWAPREEISFVRSVEEDDSPAPEAERRPSLVIVRPGDRSLWELAKEYGSTREMIESANPGGIGELLLIPRAR